jgi:signal peptidase II
LSSLRAAGGWYALALLILVLDLATKAMAEAWLDYARPVYLMPVLDFTLHYNAGAAFSFLGDAGGWQRWLFSGIAIVVSAVLAVWIARLRRHERLLALALALILGGALGNLWDRLTLGYVVDFISVHYQDWYFPTFNLADSAITVGAVLVIVDGILSGRREARQDARRGDDG